MKTFLQSKLNESHVKLPPLSGGTLLPANRGFSGLIREHAPDTGRRLAMSMEETLPILSSHPYAQKPVQPISSEHIKLAATLTFAGQSGRELLYIFSRRRVFCFELYYSTLFQAMIYSSDIILLSLVFFEEATTLNFPWWTPFALSVIEALCVGCIFCELFVKGTFLGIKRFFHHPGRCVAVLALLFLVMHVILAPVTLLSWRLVGLLRIARPYFFVHHIYPLRRSFLSVASTVPSVFAIILLLCCQIALAALVAMVLFYGEVEGDMYFPDFITSCTNLFALVTAANYPDIMIPAYQDNPWNAIFFVVFLVVGNFFLLNLVMGTLYERIQDFLIREWQQQYTRRHLAVRLCYSILTVGDPVPFYGVSDEQEEAEMEKRGETDVRVSLTAVEKYLEACGLTEHDVELYWQALELNAPNMSYDDFQTTCELLFLGMQSPKSHLQFLSFWLNFKPVVFVRNIVKARWFELAIDGIILLNLCCMAAQIIFDVETFVESTNIYLNLLNYMFSWIFVGEFFLKFLSLGPVVYWMNSWNRLDAVLVWTSIISDVLGLFLAGGFWFTRVILLFRVLRLCRLLSRFDSIKNVIQSFVQLRVTLIIFTGNIFVLFYLFAIIGMSLFGDTIQLPEDPRLQHLDYPYYATNFDSVGGAFIVLWELMVTNFVPEIVQAYTIVTNRYYSLYFYLWYFVSVLFATNVVTAGIIDSIQAIWAEEDAKQKADAGEEENEKAKEKEKEKEKENASGKDRLLRAIDRLEKLLVADSSEDSGYHWTWQSNATLSFLSRLVEDDIVEPSREAIDHFIHKVFPSPTPTKDMGSIVSS